MSNVSAIQATAEQIRLAQMIYDKNDADFEDKVNQVWNTWTFWWLKVPSTLIGTLGKDV